MLIKRSIRTADAAQASPTPPHDRAVATDADKATDGVQLLQVGETISSAGPLTRVFISTDLNCAVNHRDDVDPEFFGDTACATLLATGGVLYGPDAIPAGNVTEVPFTPVSQTPVTGTGTR